MFMRLIRDYSRDNKAAIALMTVAFMPLFLGLVYTAHDIGRYFMVQRTVASASQQTYDWIVTRGASASEDANALAKTAFTTRLGKNIVADDSSTNGIKNIMVTVSRNSKNKIARIDIKGDYNLMLGKLLNLPTFPIAATVGKVIDPPVFITIVFSSGEMRSEGNRIYGTLQTVNNAVLLPGPNRGVSWSNDYYTQIKGQAVFETRDTPTTNYFMVTALVKELAKKYAGSTLYMNIIPVSATINLNPRLSKTNQPGSNEGKLPPWVLSTGGFDVDNNYSIEAKRDPSIGICITNRSFPGTGVTSSLVRDYYEVQASEIFHTDRTGPNTTLPPVFSKSDGIGNSLTSINKNYFTHDNLLVDRKIQFNENEGNGTSPEGSAFYNRPRGYPSFILHNGSGKCPATNSTPALGTFQQVTSQDYPERGGGTTENDIFWDYMRNHIDPQKVSSYAIWGSPNMNFGLQIAYENIGNVQSTGIINNNGKMLDPNSEFLVFMVSDQIGAVKNVAGVPTAVFVDPITGINKNRIINGNSLYPQCVSVKGPGNSDGGLSSGCPKDTNILPSSQSNSTQKDFQFSHFGYDNFYNLTGPICFDGPTYQEYTCDSTYSATTVSVIQNFYNIINYSLDIKYNNDLAKKLIKPRVFFIDTGSGKPTNQCEMVNGFTLSFFDKTGSEFDPRIGNKFCTAYTDLVGYKKDPLPRKFVACAPKTNCPFSNLPSGGVSQGGIFSVTSDPPMLFAPNPSNPLKRGNLWAGDKTESITGLTGVFTYQINEFTDTNLDSKNNALFVPVQFYPIAKKLMLNSNPRSLIDENVTTSRQTNVNNAAEIASFVANNMDSFPAITSPY